MSLTPADLARRAGSQPSPKSAEHAVAFLAGFRLAVEPAVTLDDDGLVVLELRDFRPGAFADLTFWEDGSVAVYASEPGTRSRDQVVCPDAKEYSSMLRSVGAVSRGCVMPEPEPDVGGRSE